MSMWTNNIVTFYGADEDLKKVAERLYSPGVTSEEDNCFDFNKIIPIPKELYYIHFSRFNLNKKDFNWNTLIREPYFIPENKKLDDLLKEFQQLKIHLAVVVDEYGGNSGIVTMDDIVEEIVGDINDQFNMEDFYYSKIDDYNYIFEGKINLNDLYRVMNVNDQSIFESKKGESETLAGFLLEQIGFFPKRGSVIKVNNIKFTINEVDRKRIKKVEVSLKK